MWVAFGVFWGIFLTSVQMNLRIQLSDFSFTINLVFLLVIYFSLTFPFIRGFITVFMLAYITEVFGIASHGSVIIIYLVLYLCFRLIADRIFAEAYLTKAIWIVPSSILVQWVTDISINGGSHLDTLSFYWLGLILQGCFDGVAGFILFMVLDYFLEIWLSHTLRRQGDFSGADLFAVQNDQRKYL